MNVIYYTRNIHDENLIMNVIIHETHCNNITRNTNIFDTHSGMKISDPHFIYASQNGWQCDSIFTLISK